MSAGMDVFKRPRDFDDRALGVSLRPYEWEVLLALDGRTPLIQLMRRMGLADVDADEVADELTGKGLMQPCVVTYGEFMRERGPHDPLPPKTPPPPPISFKESSSPDGAKTSQAQSHVTSTPMKPTPVAPAQISAPPAGAAAKPLTETVSAKAHADTVPAKPAAPAQPVPPPAVAMKSPTAPKASFGKSIISAIIKPPPPRLSFSIRPEPRSKNGGLQAPQQRPTPQVAVGISGFKLKPLFDFIVEQAGGSNLPRIAAQLAVYRVFRRVPRELMMADNIHSFSIGDPTIEVHNKQLYDAIVRAIEATFGVAYPAGKADRAAG